MYHILITLLIFPALLMAVPGTIPTKEEIRVAPLLKTRWAQGWNYNRMCPLRTEEKPDENDNRMITGCVATAMAQIMAYHQWPPKPFAETTDYSSKNDPNNRTSWDKLLLTEPYDWEAMRPCYTRLADERSIMAVAKLMADCGIAIGMNWGNSASAGQTGVAEDALKVAFGYTCESTGLLSNANAETIKNAENNCIASLKAQQPVYVEASANKGNGSDDLNHAFVIDGYAETSDGRRLFHVDYGWARESLETVSTNWYPYAQIYYGGKVTAQIAKICPIKRILPSAETFIAIGKPYLLTWTIPKASTPVAQWTIQQELFKTVATFPQKVLNATAWEISPGETRIKVENDTLAFRACSDGFLGYGETVTLKNELSAKAGQELTLRYTVSKQLAALDPTKIKIGLWIKDTYINDGNNIGFEFKFDLSEGTHEQRVKLPRDNPTYSFYIEEPQGFPTISHREFGTTPYFIFHSITIEPHTGEGYKLQQTFVSEEPSLSVTHTDAGKYRYIIAGGDFPSAEQAVTVTATDKLPRLEKQTVEGNRFSAIVTTEGRWTAAVVSKQWGSTPMPTLTASGNSGDRLTLDLSAMSRLGTEWFAVDVTADGVTTRKVFLSHPPDTLQEGQFADNLEEAKRLAQKTGKDKILFATVNPSNQAFHSGFVEKLITSPTYLSMVKQTMILCESPRPDLQGVKTKIVLYSATGERLKEEKTSTLSSVSGAFEKFFDPYCTPLKGYIFRLR
ncbi:MAG: C10 family peptidase [Kiritimatiellia bacterium]